MGRPTLEFLQACEAVGRTVVIVSNNAEQAIDAYLERFHLHPYVHAVAAHTPGRPDLMKPHPDAIKRALDILRVAPEVCCMVGDSVSDIIVCQATGVRSVGFAKNPKRGRELADAGADAIVESMTLLAGAIVESSSVYRARSTGV